MLFCFIHAATPSTWIALACVPASTSMRGGLLGRARRLQQLLGVAAQGLEKRGASPEVQQFVEQLLQQQHQEYVAFMAGESDKRRRLLDFIRGLEVGGPCLPPRWGPAKHMHGPCLHAWISSRPSEAVSSRCMCKASACTELHEGHCERVASCRDVKMASVSGSSWQPCRHCLGASSASGALCKYVANTAACLPRRRSCAHKTIPQHQLRQQRRRLSLGAAE